MEKMITDKHDSLSFNWKALLWAILFFWYFSAVVQGLLYFSEVVGFEGFRNSLYLSLLWLIPLFLFPKQTKLIAALIGLLLWAASLSSLGYFMVYGQEFSQSVIFVMFESNTAEASEYMAQYFSFKLLFVMLAYSVVALLLWFKVKPIYLPKWIPSLASLVILSFVLIYPYVDRLVDNRESYGAAAESVLNRMEPAAPWQLVVGYYQYQKQLSRMEELLNDNRAIPPLANLKDKTGDRPRTLVLVIGESTTKAHMSLYGYPRNTNPQLTELKNTDQGLTVFNDVIAARPYTIEMLQQALTFADQKRPEDYLTTPSLINLMNQAGYKTFWITNQQTMTKRNTMLTTFSQMADEQEYLNNNRNQNAEQHDEVVIEPFKKALQDPAPKKFIVIHLLGTHMSYKYRYPDSYEIFKGKDSVMPSNLTEEQAFLYNSYDNAVRYNDFVVTSLIKSFKATTPYGFLVFLSDHGEEVYGDPKHEFIGRNEAVPTEAMYTIPFMIWRSPSWLNDYPVDFTSYVNRPYSSSHLIHTLSDLAGLSYDTFDPSNSLVNEHFIKKTRWIGDPAIKLRSFDELFPNASPKPVNAQSHDASLNNTTQ